MGIKVTLYDFFAYTIPGGFYIATFVYLGVMLGFISIDAQILESLSLSQIIAFAIIAYVTGLILDPTSRPWYYRFFSKSFNQESLDDVNSWSSIKITTDPKSWAVLLMFIRVQENSISDSIERYNATTIMLRNISFSLLLSSMITLILIFQTQFYFWNIALCVILFCLSILAGREAARFHRWFYQAMYQAIVAYGSEPADFLSKKKQVRKGK